MPSLNEPDTEMKDAALAYLRNINTQPGPNAGRSIDPSKPGPDVDRIATAAKRCWRKGANVRLKTMRPFEFFGTVYEQDSHAVTVIYDDNKLATFHADDLIEQETPSPAPSPGPQDARERFGRALYFAAEGLAPESWFIPENDGHWERWKNDGDAMSPSPLVVADALIAAFPAIAQSDAHQELSEIASAIGSTRFMDPPDGGDVSLAEQVRRMREALEKAEAALAQSDAQPVGWQYRCRTNELSAWSEWRDCDPDLANRLSSQLPFYEVRRTPQQARKIEDGEWAVPFGDTAPPRPDASEYHAALAQSDAQPVGWIYKPIRETKWQFTTDAEKARLGKTEFGWPVEPVFTAPPRPDTSGLMDAAEWHEKEATRTQSFLPALSGFHRDSAERLRARAADRSAT